MTLPEHTRQPLGPNQERWLKALESGEYKQGKGRLRPRADAFCCLGVACEIVGIAAVSDGCEWSYNGCDAYAPTELIKLLALYYSDGDSKSDSIRTSLTDLNDTGSSFKQIARIIRQDPSVYFKEPR